VHRWTDLSQIPAGFGPSVVTVGNFDGVHRGHRKVLTAMVADARSAGMAAVAVTFDPHPLQLHDPDRAPELITGVADRLDLLEETGLDAVLLQHYTMDFARQTPEQFVRRYFVDGLKASTVVVGRDVRFGWQNSGDLSTMVELGTRYGFTVEVIADVSPAHEPPGRHRRWSSTWVRELLAAGRVDDASEILGRPHRVRGTVVRGDARGRALGYPTANLGPDTVGMAPGDGVYAGWLSRAADATGGGADPMPAAISVGTNPTFDGSERRVEAYVLDRTDLDLYGVEVVVEFVRLLRPTLRFDSVAELVAQMSRDVDAARSLLAR
jgi:riboflavin kinase/FMN adenylyltransferase